MRRHLCSFPKEPSPNAVKPLPLVQPVRRGSCYIGVVVYSRQKLPPERSCSFSLPGQARANSAVASPLLCRSSDESARPAKLVPHQATGFALMLVAFPILLSLTASATGEEPVGEHEQGTPRIRRSWRGDHFALFPTAGLQGSRAIRRCVHDYCLLCLRCPSWTKRREEVPETYDIDVAFCLHFHSQHAFFSGGRYQLCREKVTPRNDSSCTWKGDRSSSSDYLLRSSDGAQAAPLRMFVTSET